MTEVLAEAVLNAVWRGIALTALVAAILRLTARWTTPAERYGVWLATLCVIAAAPFADVLHQRTAAAPLRAPTHGSMPFALHPPMPAAPPEASAEIRVSYAAGRFIAGVWPLGAAGLLLLLAVRLRFATELKRSSRSLPGQWGPLVAAWRRRLPPGRLGTTRSSAEARTPLAVGWFRPVVLLPDALLRRPADSDLFGLWLHEQAHVRRYDDWTQLFVAAASAVLWFHPSVHWIRRRLDAERETACDQAVLEDGVAPEQYARALASLAESFGSVRAPAALGAAGRKSQLLRRVEMLMSDSRKPRRSAARSAFACAAIAALSLVWWSSSVGPRAVFAQASPAPPAATPQPVPAPEPAPALAQAPALEPAPAPAPAPAAAPFPAPELAQAPAPAPLPAPEVAQAPEPAPAPPQPPVVRLPDMSALQEKMERLQVEMRPHIEEMERMAQEIEKIVEESIEPHREEIERLAEQISAKVETELEPLHEKLIEHAEELAKRHAELSDEQSRELQQRMREIEKTLQEKQQPLREMEQQMRSIAREQMRRAEIQVREVERRMQQKQREMQEVQRKLQRLEKQNEERRSDEAQPLPVI